MKPVNHSSNTRTLAAPAGWDQNGLPVDPLGITDQLVEGVPCVWSFWDPDAVELAALAAGGQVVLSIVGQTMPPALLLVTKSPRMSTQEQAGDVLALVQKRLDERDEWLGKGELPQLTGEERTTLRVLRRAEAEIRRLREFVAGTRRAAGSSAQIPELRPDTSAEHEICDACECVAHCRKNGCIPISPLPTAPGDQKS